MWSWSGELPSAGEVQPLLLDLVDRGIIRILGIAFLTKAADGSVSALDVGDLKQLDIGHWAAGATQRNQIPGRRPSAA